MQYLPLLQLLPAIIGLMQMVEKNSEPGAGAEKKRFVVGVVQILFGEMAKSSGRKDEFNSIKEPLDLLIEIIVKLFFK
jgi:hypothetical protein